MVTKYFPSKCVLSRKCLKEDGKSAKRYEFKLATKKKKLKLKKLGKSIFIKAFKLNNKIQCALGRVCVPRLIKHLIEKLNL